MQTKGKDTATDEKLGKGPPPQLHAIQTKSKQFTKKKKKKKNHTHKNNNNK